MERTKVGHGSGVKLSSARVVRCAALACAEAMPHAVGSGDLGVPPRLAQYLEARRAERDRVALLGRDGPACRALAGRSIPCEWTCRRAVQAALDRASAIQRVSS